MNNSIVLQDKLSEHVHNVDEFHGTLKTFTDWLNTAEVAMRSFKYPSKLVDRVTIQMAEHDVSCPPLTPSPPPPPHRLAKHGRSGHAKLQIPE